MSSEKQLFQALNDGVATVRNGISDIEPLAVEWTKAAQAKFLSTLSFHYRNLQNSLELPPDWAMDSTSSLLLATETLPAILLPYKDAIYQNLDRTLQDWGFEHYEIRWQLHCFFVEIYFMTSTTNAARADGRQRRFSQTVVGIPATEFHRLIEGHRKFGGAHSSDEDNSD
ncbi:hypothetical protein B0H16DRAFT_1689311 [Mycena metata]|uniref:Uncharacterized protein n=1 Tax=Mycena metata TaxID=1033252 RepID=A0AAD7J8B2_9AGAR|nr:hypothetical protein B0H16DRAFT_1689311 [Mycena metata]